MRLRSRPTRAWSACATRTPSSAASRTQARKNPIQPSQSPVAANLRQPGVVLLLLTLEGQADVEQGLLQQIPMLDEQRDQEPADAAVAIEERMDRLELRMGETNPNQGRQTAIVMQPPLQRREGVGDGFGRRWDKAGVAGPAAADPVLRPAEFTRAACPRLEHPASGCGANRTRGGYSAADPQAPRSVPGRVRGHPHSCRSPGHRRDARFVRVASKVRTSGRVACVPSICEVTTASLRTKP